MLLSESLDKAIRQGMDPDTTMSIPVNLDRLNKHVQITKSRTILIGGEPTAAKTTMAQTSFIVDPIEWYLQHKPKGVKLSVISFLMERKMEEYTSRWISRMIFRDHGTNIHPGKILGRFNDNKLTKAEYDIVSRYYRVLNEWEADDLLIASQGGNNPSGIRKFLRAFARKHGTIHLKDKEDKSDDNILVPIETYEPNHPNHIVLVIGDNASVLDSEQGLKQTELVSLFSHTMKYARDVFSMSPVIVQHLNRDISGTARQKLGDLVPKLSDFADSSQTQKAADVVLALLNPTSHITKESGHSYLGYDLMKMRDANDLTYFRSLHILKNNFGGENISYPLGIHPTFGILKILPRATSEVPIPESMYDNITSGRYFLPGY